MPEPVFDRYIDSRDNLPCDGCMETSPTGFLRCGICGLWLCPVCMADHRFERVAAHIHTTDDTRLRARSLCRFVEHLGTQVGLERARGELDAIVEWHNRYYAWRREQRAIAEALRNGVPMPDPEDEA